MLQVAITETVKVITNITDIGATLKDGSYTTDSYVATKTDSRYILYVTLRESKSLVALQLLRDSTGVEKGDDINTKFSRTMSKKLNESLYARISYWKLLEITQPPTSRPSSPSSKPTSSPSSKPSSPSSQPSSPSKISSKSKVISLISAHLQSS